MKPGSQSSNENDKYTLENLWDDLKNNYKIFIAQNMEADSEEDKKAFELSECAIKKIMEIGLKVEKISSILHPKKKSRLVTEAKDLFTKQFGDESASCIKGKKSETFVKQIIVPFADNCLKIEPDERFSFMNKFIKISFEVEKEEIRKTVTLLKNMLKMDVEVKQELSQSPSLLRNQSCFANQTHTRMELESVESHVKKIG